MKRTSVYGLIGGAGFSGKGSVGFENEMYNTEGEVTRLGYQVTQAEIQTMDSLKSTQFVSIEPLGDGKTTVIAINFHQDHLTSDNRGHPSPAYVRAELPTEMAGEFESAIVKDPDLLERFYQKVFPNLDTQEKGKSMRRIKTDGFAIINSRNAAGLAKLIDTYLHPKRYLDYNPWAVEASIRKATIKYKNGPYGSGLSLKETLK